MIFLRASKIQSALDFVLFPVFVVAIRARCFKFAALVTALVTFRLNGKQDRRLLFFDRSIFRNDLEAMVQVSGQVQYLGVQRKYFKKIMNLYLGRQSFSEVTYHHDSSLNQSKEKLRETVHIVMDLLHKLLKFDGIISCNFGYPEQQELFEVAQQRGWPVIILYKEGLLPRQQLDYLFQEYRKKILNCDLLLCYNDDLVRRFRRSGIPGVGRVDVVATGIPRLDPLKYVPPADKSDQLVFFSFFLPDKVRYAALSASDRSEVESVAREFHEWVIRLALENPTISVVIKTKAAPHYLDYVNNLVSQYLGPQRLAPNIRITNTESPSKLIEESYLVLGSHSTVLLEGLLTGRVVGCPQFATWFEKENSFFPKDISELARINEYQDLLTLVNQARAQRLTSDRRLPAGVGELIATTNFDASLKAEREIVKLLQSRSGRRLAAE